MTEFRQILGPSGLHHRGFLLGHSVQRLQDIENIVQATLFDRPLSTCQPNDRLVITGNFIFLRDLKESNCNQSFKRIVIHSWNTLFIDEDFIEDESPTQITIFSPRIHVIGRPKVKLGGKDGRPHVPDRVTTLDSSRNSLVYGDSSSDRAYPGQPGKSGGDGGSLFLIGLQIHGQQNGKFECNGGHGGPGQHGEHGGPHEPEMLSLITRRDAVVFRNTHEQNIDSLGEQSICLKHSIAAIVNYLDLIIKV